MDKGFDQALVNNTLIWCFTLRQYPNASNTHNFCQVSIAEKEDQTTLLSPQINDLLDY
jgi:hypothetical protein